MTSPPKSVFERPATDWPDPGDSAVRSLLAEGVVAEIAERDAPGKARWFGGQTRGYDVWTMGEEPSDRGILWDAKSVVIHKDHVILARANGEPYDPTKVDFIVLVHMGKAETGFAIDLATGTARMEGRSEILDVWRLPVSDINAMMPGPNEDGRNYRNVQIPLEDIEPYREPLDGKP